MIAEIAEKLRDALSMFWQTLDSEERRMLALYGCYLAAVLVASAQRTRRERERETLVELVTERLAHGR